MFDDAADALAVAEASLRDLVGSVMAAEFSQEWLATSGIDPVRVAEWEDRRKSEVKRRGRYAASSARILLFAEFRDLQMIISSHWDQFHAVFGNKSRFVMDMERLADFRNSLAHGRELIPYERALVVGTAGLIRNAVTVHMSKKAPGGKEFFPRFEWVGDSFGTERPSGAVWVLTSLVLHPGDRVRFECRWWDPEGQPCDTSWRVSERAREAFDDSFEWHVAADDIGESVEVSIRLLSRRDYHRSRYHDDTVSFFYTVLPST